jgi:hypothetical protein
MRGYFERFDPAVHAPYRSWWLCLAIVSAALFGFELAGYRYGHGDPRHLSLTAFLLLMSMSFLATSRRVALALHFGFLITAVLWAVLIVRLGIWHTPI